MQKIKFETDVLWIFNPLGVFWGISLLSIIGKEFLVIAFSLPNVEKYGSEIIYIISAIAAIVVMYRTRKEKLPGMLWDKLVVGFMALMFLFLIVLNTAEIYSIISN
jgi:hypothetical protein